MIVLRTERLRLREMTDGDVDLVLSILKDPVTESVWQKSFTREDAAAWVAKQRRRYAADGFGYWICERLADGAVVGQAGVMTLEFDGGGREPGLGYILSGEHRGAGYATEAARACLDWAFERIAGAARVIAAILPENRASMAVAERLGMRARGRASLEGWVHEIYALERGELAGGGGAGGPGESGGGAGSSG